MKRSCRSEEHTSELQSQSNLVCRLLLEKKKGTSRAARPAPGPAGPLTRYARTGRRPPPVVRRAAPASALLRPAFRVWFLFFFLIHRAPPKFPPFPPPPPSPS